MQQTFPGREQGLQPDGTLMGIQQGLLGSEDAITSFLPVHSGPALHPSLLLSHFLTLKMSVLEENPGMKMDCEDWERDEPQCSSEGKILI